MLDLIVIGGGLAGASAAYEAATAHGRVLIVTAGPREGGSSWHAQGGIAVPTEEADEVRHMQDTLVAGRGLCQPQAVASIIGEALSACHWLEQIGAQFERKCGREGGHSRSRIRHQDGDRTGRYVMRVVVSALDRLGNSPKWLTHHRALALMLRDGHVDGVWLQGPTGKVFPVRARAVLLATGGIGRLYAHTTNPAGALGSGIALGWQAGAVIRDVELVQFHPTVLPDQTLVTEAVRGAGGRLVNAEGHYFMGDYDADADLAPRDVVARAVAREIARTGEVCLDLAAVHDVDRSFPGLSECLKRQPNAAKDARIPVQPGAHYAMGGLKTDLCGQTTVPGLYAAGEVASTGLHGANRLASNSLLEAMIMGRRSALHALSVRARPASARAAMRAPGPVADGVLGMWPKRMTDSAGLFRDSEGLRRLASDLGGEADAFKSNACSALQSAIVVCRLIVQGALDREESRGGHWRVDYPRPATDAYHIEQWRVEGRGDWENVRRWRRVRLNDDTPEESTNLGLRPTGTVV